MLAIYQTSQFRADLKRARKRDRNLLLLGEVVNKHQNEEPLPAARRDHALTGDYAGNRECHIQPDWLLIYRVDHGQLILVLQRTGSHSDLM